MNEAQRNLEKARAKEAMIYAPEQYLKAERVLKEAKRLVVDKNYKKAKQTADTASKLSIQAVAISEAIKTGMIEETERAIREAGNQINSIRAWRPPKSAKKRFEKIRKIREAELESLAGDLNLAKTKLSENKIQEARQTVESVSKKLSDHMRSLDAFSTKPGKRKR